VCAIGKISPEILRLDNEGPHRRRYYKQRTRRRLECRVFYCGWTLHLQSPAMMKPGCPKLLHRVSENPTLFRRLTSAR